MPTPERDQRDDSADALSAYATPDSAEAGAHVPSVDRGATAAGRPEAGAPEFSGPASEPGHPADSERTAGDPREPGAA